MKVPNSKNAFIPLSKLSDYLLSENHAVGRSKAGFFKALGFTRTNIDLLKEMLLRIVQNENITEAISAPYGIKYVIDGVLEAPNKTSVRVRTVWIIEKEEGAPRFVTAYPS